MYRRLRVLSLWLCRITGTRCSILVIRMAGRIVILFISRLTMLRLRFIVRVIVLRFTLFRMSYGVFFIRVMVLLNTCLARVLVLEFLWSRITRTRFTVRRSKLRVVRLALSCNRWLCRIPNPIAVTLMLRIALIRPVIVRGLI